MTLKPFNNYDLDEDWIDDIAMECKINGVPFYDKRDPSSDGFTRREWAQEWMEKMKGEQTWAKD